jgi:hypothetical protein
MPYFVAIEFKSEAHAEAFFRKVEADKPQPAHGAEMITLPKGADWGSTTISTSC